MLLAKNYKVASFEKRLLANGIDYLFILIYFAIYSLIIYISQNRENKPLWDFLWNIFEENYNLIIYGFIFSIIVNFIITPNYFKNGQTIGKKILKLKVINSNGEEASIERLFVRFFVGIIILEFGALTLLVSLLLNLQLQQIGVNLIIHTILLLVSIMLTIFSKTQRSLHDRIFKTVVISINNIPRLLIHKK